MRRILFLSMQSAEGSEEVAEEVGRRRTRLGKTAQGLGQQGGADQSPPGQEQQPGAGSSQQTRRSLSTKGASFIPPNIEYLGITVRFGISPT
ncbi:hypothetical protein CEXT_137391 [Caerostris extrusa]|uniref:Uncharacterized protein n=1 Tax=Caerostris extrusa TaxID=172846 RepID=A0AAV4WHQ4_CAEEX|nr:hypothetical protein CEXT_137391 [Caerostris extrusa]